MRIENSFIGTLVMRFALWPLLAVLASIPALEAQAIDSNSPNARMSLNGTWQFALAPTEQDAEELAGFHEPTFDATAFAPVPVPSNWAVLGYEEPVYRGFHDGKASEGFYVRDFTPPAAWKASRVLLHFGGVWSSAEVWLNGKRLGRHDSGYTSFAFEVTGALKAGEKNRLAVRVRQATREYTLDVYDDWTLGGIFRDVSLEAMPRERWLDRVIARTEFDDSFRDADLNLRIMVGDTHRRSRPGNLPSPGEPYDLRIALLSKEGVEVARHQMTIPAHTSTSREIPVSLRVNTPRQWTAETPYLYTLRVELLEKGVVAHRRSERIGFRQISTEGGVFRINGQAVKLRGVNRHDQHPDVGRATTREHWEQDIALMKAANINYIRLAHYPPAKGFVELCDEMGMYLGNEVSMGGGGKLYDPSMAGAVLLRSYETVMRDINSPSIVYWSIGNENPLTDLQLASARTVKGLDPTRPILLPWRAEEWLPPEIDILAPHYWQPQEYDQLAGHSARPVITTEYTHAYGTHGFGGLEARWKALTRHPAGAGAAIWVWADQAIRMPTAKKGELGDEYLRLTTDGWDGLVDADRNPSRDYWEAKAVYAQVYPEVDEIRFVPGQKSARIPIRNDYDFTDLEAVKVAWSIFEDDRELAAGTSELAGQPHATSPFVLPLEAVQSIRPGKAYYAWLVFADANGAEITRESVELVPNVTAGDRRPASYPVSVTRGETVAISAGPSRYEFDPKTGHLVSASSNGKRVITDLRPVIWRELDTSEVFVIGEAAAEEAADLNQYEPVATAWALRETEEGVTISAEVDYVVDARNRFAATYRYSVARDGDLRLQYKILPDVVVPSVPVVGMAIESVPELDQLRWFGLGPHDAYPNKRSAPILGVWDGGSAGLEAVGTKAMRWLERTGSPGGFRVTGVGYFERGLDDPRSVRILSGVLGRPEKRRKADESIPPLRTETGEPFIGELTLSLL